MSFLDNLENNLKALENREERDPEKIKRDHEHCEAERNAALLRAPHAEALKNSAFTSSLLTECRAIGHAKRVLVRFTWIGESLRLDAGSRRLQLFPTISGINAVFSVDGAEVRQMPLDLAVDDPAALARNWLTDPQ